MHYRTPQDRRKDQRDQYGLAYLYKAGQDEMVDWETFEHLLKMTKR